MIPILVQHTSKVDFSDKAFSDESNSGQHLSNMFGEVFALEINVIFSRFVRVFYQESLSYILDDYEPMEDDLIPNGGGFRVSTQ